MNDNEEWHQLAAALRAMPGVVERLVADHVPDELGRCRGCTTPGTGRPNRAWPCSIRKLADDARRQRDARGDDGPAGVAGQ